MLKKKIIIAGKPGPTGAPFTVPGPTGAPSTVTGPTGASITGPTGSSITGPTGASITGPTGDPGATGASVTVQRAADLPVQLAPL